MSTAVGVVRVAVVVPLVLALMAAVFVPLVAAAVVAQVLYTVGYYAFGMGLPPPSLKDPALLSLRPGFGLLLGIYYAAVSSPLRFVRKLVRHCAGCTVGEPAPMPLAGKGKQCVNRLEALTINGARHVVRLRGHDAGSPLLLIMHGGPGMSEMMSAARADGGLRHEHLEQRFVVCDYDQRSALCSGALNPTDTPSFQRTLTVQQHVDDAVAIAEWLRADPMLRNARSRGPRAAATAQQDAVHLLGGSWGSTLALRTAAAAPHLFASPVIVRGQMTHSHRSEEIGYGYILQALTQERYTRRRRDGLRAIHAVADAVGGGSGKELRYVGRDGVHHMLVQRGLLGAYGGMSYREFKAFERTKTCAPMWRLQFDKGSEAMLSTEVTLAAVLWAKANLVTSLACMSHEIWGTDAALTGHVGGGLSIVVAHGVQDMCTAAPLVKDYVAQVLSVDKGCTKELVWFERSGHSPDKEEPAQFAAMMCACWGLAPADQCVYKRVRL